MCYTIDWRGGPFGRNIFIRKTFDEIRGIWEAGNRLLIPGGRCHHGLDIFQLGIRGNVTT